MNCKKFMVSILKNTSSITLYSLFKICLKGYDAVTINKDFNLLLKYNNNIKLVNGIVYYRE